MHKIKRFCFFYPSILGIIRQLHFYDNKFFGTPPMKLHFLHFLLIGSLVGILCILYGLEALLLMGVGASLYALFHDYSTWQLGKALAKKVKALEKEREAEREVEETEEDK